ncbi:MAG: hypothetical protein GC192_06470 [Bacteroidetes bacterium]|nr:hypothetical protein [Bacteroidota bacterium]
MKKLFFALVLSIIASSGMAQSYIGLSAGVDWAKIGDEGNTGAADFDFDITDNGFSKRSKSFSISWEHYNSKKLSIELSFSCAKKDFESNFYGIATFKGRMKYKSYGGAFLMKYYFSDYFYIGTGLSMIYIKDLIFYRDNMARFDVPNNDNDKYGAPVLLGLKYKNFYIEPYYLQGFWLGRKSDERNKYDINPINAIGFQVGYQIRISKKKNTVYSF